MAIWQEVLTGSSEAATRGALWKKLFLNIFAIFTGLFMWPPNSIQRLMCFFFFLIKVDDERFCCKNSSQYLISLPIIVSVLINLGWCNGRKLQNSWDFAPDLTWWVYSIPYCHTRFPLCQSYNYSLQTLSL